MSRSNLGTYFETHNQMHEAITQYQAAVDLTSDPMLLAQTYANLGAAQRALALDDDAHTSFDQSLRFNPTQFNAWLGLGLLAQKQGKLEEAITDLRKSVELQPTAEGYFELGRCLVQSGRVSDAITAYEQALKLAPDPAPVQQAIDSLRQQQR